MQDQVEKKPAPAFDTEKQTPYWGQFIVDILKKLLEFNQLPSGIKKKF